MTKNLNFLGLVLAVFVFGSGFSLGGSFGLPPKGAPSEVTYLLPKFECAQAPTAARCCPVATPGSLFAADGCCQAHGEIMDARKTAVKTAHPGYSNEQVLNAILGPFTQAENSQYVTGCCNPRPEPYKSCCQASMTAGDLSVCVDVPPPSEAGAEAGTATESLAKLECWAAPENMAKSHGKDVIIALDPHGQPTKITCGLMPPSVEVSTPEGPVSDMTALMTTVSAARVEFSQVKGDVTVVPDGGLISASSVLAGTTLVMKSEALPGAVPAATMTFSAPPLATGANVQAAPEHNFSFVAVAYNGTGQPVLTASADVPTIVGFASGGGCGCGKGELTPHDQFIAMWRNLLLTLAGLLIPYYALRRKTARRNPSNN